LSDGPAPAHTKVSRSDWVDAAAAALDEVPIDKLRVLTLAGDLSVSRSSFYWYFTDLAELHRELLVRWERNTVSIVDRTNRSSNSIIQACLGVFECWADKRLYDATLDLAVRDWGRRDSETAKRVAEADRQRLDALTTMFSNHEFSADDALVRARLVYHSQVGYYAVGTDEPMVVRQAYLPYYLEAITGQTASEEELIAFEQLLAAIPQ